MNLSVLPYYKFSDNQFHLLNIEPSRSPRGKLIVVDVAEVQIIFVFLGKMFKKNYSNVWNREQQPWTRLNTSVMELLYHSNQLVASTCQHHTLSIHKRGTADTSGNRICGPPSGNPCADRPKHITQITRHYKRRRVDCL